LARARSRRRLDFPSRILAEPRFKIIANAPEPKARLTRASPEPFGRRDTVAGRCVDDGMRPRAADAIHRFSQRRLLPSPFRLIIS
jgi:hypothetical protein